MSDDDEILPVPADQETIRNLTRIGRAVGEHPLRQVARDVLRLGAAAALAEIEMGGRLHS